MHWALQQAINQIEVLEGIVDRRFAPDDPDGVHAKVRMELLRSAIDEVRKDEEVVDAAR